MKEVAAQTKTPPPDLLSSSSKGKAKETNPTNTTLNSSTETNQKRKASTSSLAEENSTMTEGGRDDKRLKRDRDSVDASGSSTSKNEKNKGSNSSINGIKSSTSTSSTIKGKGKSRDLEDPDESMDSPTSNSKGKESKLNGNGLGSSGKKVGGNNPNGRNGKAGASGSSGKKKNSGSNLADGNGGGDDSIESTTTGTTTGRENDDEIGEETETEKELKAPKHKKGKKVTSTTSTTTTSTSSKPGPKAGSGRLPPDNLPPPKLTPLPSSLQTPKLTISSNKVTALTGHSAEVFVTAWNPSVPGLIASGAGDATVRIWEVPEGSGGAIVTPTTKSKASSSSETNPDPNQRLIEPPAICKHLPSTHSKDVSAMSWNPDGTLLASGSHDGILRLWTPQGDLHLVLSMHQGPIFGVKWNRRGTEILTGSQDGTAIVWDMQSGKVKQQFSLHSDSVLDVDWLTGGYPESETSILNDNSKGNESSSSHSRRSTTNSSSSEPRKLLALDNIFATGSADNSIKILRVGDSKPIRTLRGHTDEVNAIRFDPSATILASASDDHTARLWSVGSELGVTSNNSIGGLKNNVGRRGNTPNRRDNEERKRRDSQGLEDRNSSSRDESSGLNRDLSFSSLGGSTSLPSGTVVNSNSNDDLKSNSSKSNSPHPMLEDDDNSSSLNRKELPSFSCLFVLKGHTRELYSLAWSPSNSTSISNANSSNGNDGNQSPPPRLLATTSFDHTCRIWNSLDGSCLRVLQNHSEAVYSVAWSPLGRWIATGGQDCRVFVCEVEVSRRGFPSQIMDREKANARYEQGKRTVTLFGFFRCPRIDSNPLLFSLHFTLRHRLVTLSNTTLEEVESSTCPGDEKSPIPPLLRNRNQRKLMEMEM